MDLPGIVVVCLWPKSYGQWIMCSVAFDGAPGRGVGNLKRGITGGVYGVVSLVGH